MDTSIILPTYNEKENIGHLVEALAGQLVQRAWKSEIVVVDDNSPDGTAEAVRGVNPPSGVEVRCLVRSNERGLATAIAHGIINARGERVLVMDTDFNHSPGNILEMLDRLEECDLVIGSRFLPRGGMEDRVRQISSMVYNWFIRAILWHGVSDSLSGFFAMRRQDLMQLDMDSIFQGYGEYFIRLTWAAKQRGLRRCEIPVFYSLRQAGVSKSRLGKMLVDYTTCALKLRFGKPG